MNGTIGRYKFVYGPSGALSIAAADDGNSISPRVYELGVEDNGETVYASVGVSVYEAESVH